MRDTRPAPIGARENIAKQELIGRIRGIHLEESLAGLACDLCLEQVPVEEALRQIQDRALERMVPLLDARILNDPGVIQSCLEMVAEESERLALQALEKGTEMLQEGLTLLEGLEEFPSNGYVN